MSFNVSWNSSSSCLGPFATGASVVVGCCCGLFVFLKGEPRKARPRSGVYFCAALSFEVAKPVRVLAALAHRTRRHPQLRRVRQPAHRLGRVAVLARLFTAHTESWSSTGPP